MEEEEKPTEVAASTGTELRPYSMGSMAFCKCKRLARYTMRSTWLLHCKIVCYKPDSCQKAENFCRSLKSEYQVMRQQSSLATTNDNIYEETSQSNPNTTH
nr:hypothetical protein [Tanacetum cinerariifolium]